MRRGEIYALFAIEEERLSISCQVGLTPARAQSLTDAQGGKFVHLKLGELHLFKAMIDTTLF